MSSSKKVERKKKTKHLAVCQNFNLNNNNKL